MQIFPLNLDNIIQEKLLSLQSQLSSNEASLAVLPAMSADKFATSENKPGPLFYFGRGVSDIYRLFRKNPELLKEALIADKIIGKGAAVVMAAAGIKAVITNVMSESACEVFKSASIPFIVQSIVPHIINRTKTGMCPLETRLRTYSPNDISTMLNEIDAFVESLRNPSI